MQPIAIPNYEPVIHLCAILILGLTSILMGYIIPQEQPAFFCSDTTIRYPKTFRGLDRSTLYGLGYTLVGIIIIFYEEWTLHKPKRVTPATITWCNLEIWPGLVRFYYFWGWYVLGAILTVLLTNIAKYSTSRLAPNFLAICQPYWREVNCEVLVEGDQWSNALSNYVLVSKGELFVQANCYAASGPETLAAARSFPSLQAAFASFSVVYLALYLHFRVFGCGMRLLKVLCYLGLVILAALVCFSRISGHFNHTTDVLWGVILGVIVGLASALYLGRLAHPPIFLGSSILVVPEGGQIERVDKGTGVAAFWDSVNGRAVISLMRDRSMSF